VTTVVQRFCDGLYGYDTVWSAIYFTPAEQLHVRHYDVDAEATRAEGYGGRRAFAFDCSLPPVYLFIYVFINPHQDGTIKT